MPRWPLLPRLMLVPALALGGGCFGVSASKGGGDAAFRPPRQIDPADVALPTGYRIEAVATGLTFPTGVAFDDQDRAYVTEAGYSYGEVWTTPRLLRIEDNGTTTVVATGDDPPWNGVTYHDGAFFVAAAGHADGGRILRIAPDGKTTVLIDGLPSLGDHHTNGPAVGPDGMIYFGQGTATNSGVVGIDNYKFGWLERHPRFHDIPARDVRLAGTNYATPNPLTPDDGDDRVVTGAYAPFGAPTEPGQVIPGRVPFTGGIMRVAPDGSGAPEMVAWGLRNPFGLAFAPDGTLYVTENQFDVRGSRPVWGTGDLLWRISEHGLWYGWPDYFAGMPLDGEWFAPPGEDPPQRLLLEDPNPPPAPLAKLGVHSSSNGLDVARDDTFAPAGTVFIAQFGDMAPQVGKVMAPVGYRVVTVDPETGVITPFAANKGETHAPASWLNTAGLERPTDVQFSPDGRALYVVDFGVMTMADEGPVPREGTGVLWRITRDGE